MLIAAAPARSKQPTACHQDGPLRHELLQTLPLPGAVTAVSTRREIPAPLLGGRHDTQQLIGQRREFRRHRVTGPLQLPGELPDAERNVRGDLIGHVDDHRTSTSPRPLMIEDRASAPRVVCASRLAATALTAFSASRSSARACASMNALQTLARP